MGPRQIIGEPSSTRKPMDITLRPQTSRGVSLPSSNLGCSSMPSILGAEGP